MHTFIDPFQKQIWLDKYQYKDETYKNFCSRLSDNIFSADEIKNEKLFSMLVDFKVLFGGRINANIGVSQEGLTLFNCFIESVTKNPDSLEGILNMLGQFCITLKSEGGVGFCANFFRPAKTLIRKIGVGSPGSVKFLEIFDKASEVITSGSVDKNDSYQGIPTKKSIRKGATMVTMSINHPDIEDFIGAKATPNKLTKMNMSVLISDAFMYAVQNDMDWDLWFPDINFEKYDELWDGNFEKWAEKGFPVVIYKTVRANYLWDLLLKSSYTRNEPGILFIDNARKMNNLSYLNGDMLSTNPCVAAGTLVTTNNGVKLVENINIDDVIQTTLGFGKVKEVKIYEDQDIFRVYFSDGFYQDVTKGHIFHTMLCDTESRKKWSNSDRLSDINVNYFVRKEWYKSYPTINKALTRDEGLLIGLYLGDGCYSNYSGFNISTNVIEDNSYIEELFNRLGGNTRIDKSEGNCCRYYLTGIKQYIDNLFNTVGINPDGKKIELCKLINTNKMFIVGLIDGLISSDGNINLSARYPQIRFDNANFEIHTLLKHLMLFVKSDYKVYNSKRVGERSSINGRFIERKQICYTGVIDNDSILNVYNELDYVSHRDKNNKLCTIIKTNQLNGVKWKTKIKSIERIGSGTVYDIYESIADDWNHEGYVSRGCGEIFGHTGIEYIDGKAVELGDVCNLGSINLTKFFDVEKNKFCLIDFKEAIDVMVSALDNIIEISAYPLPMYEQAAKLKRKIGIGLMGIGSLMMMMNLRYGGDECLDVLDVILKEFINQAYKSSALLAKEKGTFALYSPELIECGYVKNGLLSKEVISLINKHGLRHSALIAIAPTGTLSIVAGNISGGVEPVFAREFTRWNRLEGKKADFKYPNIHIGEWFETDYFKEEKVADEVILISTDGKFRIDKNTGLCEKITITDYGYKIALEKGFTETATAMELSVEEHLKVLKLVSSYTDQGISKTINLPNDISFDSFKSLYGEIHSYGVKGCTTYREGTSIAVLETQKKEQEKSVKKQQTEFLEVFEEQKNGDIITSDVQLPDEYPAKGYIFKSDGGKKWYVHVAFKDKACTRPFAIFVNTNNREDNVLTFNAIEKLEEIAIFKGINNYFMEETKKKYAYQKNPVKICRMLGLLLRHNVDVFTIIKGLSELEPTVGTFVFHITKFLGRFVKEHDILGMVCPECGEKSMKFYEGCISCTCGYSRCG